ncbi:MAG: hypothetical protein AAF399_25900 [Bacteroidota bacterium]
MTHQTSLPKPPRKEASPPQFIWIGSISLQIGAMLQLLVWQVGGLSFTQSLISFLGVYVSSATFLLVGVIQNRIKSKQETPSKLDVSLMEFDSEWEEQVAIQGDITRTYQK